MYLLGMESKITAQAMLQYGVNNVRGSMFCSPRNYDISDINVLTKFLGHYNDLDYGKVYSRLCRTLQHPPHLVSRGGAGAASGGKEKRTMNTTCEACGNAGHVAATCTAIAQLDGTVSSGVGSPAR